MYKTTFLRSFLPFQSFILCRVFVVFVVEMRTKLGRHWLDTDAHTVLHIVQSKQQKGDRLEQAIEWSERELGLLSHFSFSQFSLFSLPVCACAYACVCVCVLQFFEKATTTVGNEVANEVYFRTYRAVFCWGLVLLWR